VFAVFGEFLFLFPFLFLCYLSVWRGLCAVVWVQYPFLLLNILIHRSPAYSRKKIPPLGPRNSWSCLVVFFRCSPWSFCAFAFGPFGRCPLSSQVMLIQLVVLSLNEMSCSSPVPVEKKRTDPTNVHDNEQQYIFRKFQFYL